MLSGVQRSSPQFQTLWLLVSQLDFWVDRERRAVPQGWAEGDWINAQLERCDEMEALLRQVASTVHVKRTGDQEAGDRIRGLVSPGDDIAPSWLIDDSRSYSQAIHKQRSWLRGAQKSNAGPKGDDGKGKPKGKGDSKGKKGKADGKGASADTQH